MRASRVAVLLLGLCAATAGAATRKVLMDEDDVDEPAVSLSGQVHGDVPSTCREDRSVCVDTVCLCLTGGGFVGWWGSEDSYKWTDVMTPRILLSYVPGVQADQFRGFWETATGLRVEYVSKPTDIDTERDSQTGLYTAQCTIGGTGEALLHKAEDCEMSRSAEVFEPRLVLAELTDLAPESLALMDKVFDWNVMMFIVRNPIDQFVAQTTRELVASMPVFSNGSMSDENEMKMILEIGQIMADPVKFSTFLSDKYIPYLKYIAFRQDSRFILRYEDLRNRPVMEMTEFMETTGVGKYFGLGSGTIKYMLDEDRLKVVTFEEVPKFNFSLETFGSGFDVLDLSHVAESLTPHLELIEQFGYSFSFNATSRTDLSTLPAKHEDEVQRRAERHAARLNYVGRYYDTKSITLPSLTGTGGEDRYDDYKPTTAEWLMDQWFEWLWVLTLILVVLLVLLLVVAFFKMKTGQAKKDEGDNEDVDPLLGDGGKKKSVKLNRSTAKSFVKSVEMTCYQGVRTVLCCGCCFNAKAGRTVAAVVKKAADVKAAVVKKATTKSSDNRDSAEDNIASQQQQTASVEMAPIKQTDAPTKVTKEIDMQGIMEKANALGKK